MAVYPGSKQCALPIDTRVYPVRWYILLVFSLLGFAQAMVFNTWGPIANSAKRVFPGWTDATVALLTNWGNICYVIFLVPVCWVMDTKGLRKAVVGSAILVALGTGLRCITMNGFPATVLINLGQIVNGVAVIVVYSGPPLLSCTWFPASERTTATSVSTSLLYLGIAAGSIVGPYVLHDFDHSNTDSNITQIPLQEVDWENATSAGGSDGEIYRDRIRYLMYGEFLMAVLLAVCTTIYFPDQPEIPPSITASVDRLSFIKGMRDMVRNPEIWKTVVPYALAGGVYLNWITMITINLEALDISQYESGWIGFYAVVSGCVAAILIARVIDYIGGKMKFTIIILMFASGVCFIWFTLIYISYLPFSKVSLYLSIILGGTLNSCLVPLFFELAVEIAFPVSESIVGGFLTGVLGVIGAIYLLLFFIPNIGVSWMNYVLIGSTLLPIPLMLTLHEEYGRAHIDKRGILDKSRTSSVGDSVLNLSTSGNKL